MNAQQGRPPGGWRLAALVAIKAVHTAAFFSIGSCLAYLFYSGVKKRSDRRAAIAAAVVAGETLIYAGNRMRCPLTGLAERFGAASGSVSDIYLPRWVADRIAEITAPVFAEGSSSMPRTSGETRWSAERHDGGGRTRRGGSHGRSGPHRTGARRHHR